MPQASDLVPKPADRCVVCGRGLGAEPFWMLEPHSPAHERCVPWDRRPFPHASLLRRLRALRSRLARASKAVDATIAMLERGEAAWPRGSRVFVARTRKWRERLEAHLRELGVGPLR